MMTSRSRARPDSTVRETFCSADGNTAPVDRDSALTPVTSSVGVTTNGLMIAASLEVRPVISAPRAWRPLAVTSLTTRGCTGWYGVD